MHLVIQYTHPMSVVPLLRHSIPPYILLCWAELSWFIFFFWEGVGFSNNCLDYDERAHGWARGDGVVHGQAGTVEISGSGNYTGRLKVSGECEVGNGKGARCISILLVSVFM